VRARADRRPPTLRIVGRLAGILEDEIVAANRDQFWHDARRKLDKLHRLTQRDILATEIMLAKRVPKPEPVQPQSPQSLHAGAREWPYRSRQAT
jgi:hypothetical protein